MIYLIIGAAIVGYWSAIFIHELSHFATFKLRGVKMRGLYIWPLLFLRKENKWKLQFKQINILTLGGIAIPDLYVIKTHKAMKKISGDFAIAIIVAPLMSLLFNLVIGIGTYSFLRTSKNEVFKVLCMCFLLGVSICTLFITITSCMKGSGAYGDYAAYRMFKKDDTFAVHAAYQYLDFSTQYKKTDKDYLRNKVVQSIEKTRENQCYENTVLGSVNTLLEEYLTGEISSFPLEVETYIENILAHYPILLYESHYEALRILLYNLIPYLMKSNRERALELHKELQRRLTNKDKVSIYYRIRNEHILGINDYGEYLREPKNIISGMLYELLGLFDAYYEDEWKIAGIKKELS